MSGSRRQPTLASSADVARDFDALARALETAPHYEALTPAERQLLRHVPATARCALDVGCGDGVVTRALARRGLAVVAIDISPRMVALARSRTSPELRVDYRVEDIMTSRLHGCTFDVVLSVNMVHHVALPDVVGRLAEAVAPGGVLLIQDVVTRGGLGSLPLNIVATMRRRLRRLVTPSRITTRVAKLYAAHGMGETYLAPSEVAAAYEELLPGARVEHHLEWRYSVIWTRPA